MTGYSFAAWTAYCRERVRPQHIHDPEQIARLDRLLNSPGVETAWRNLAHDVSRTGPAYLTWQVALHDVMGTLVFPPNMLPKPDTERDKWIVAARASARATGRVALPLIPAMRGRNAQRNWVALYVKTWIVPALFNRRHYEDIATLVDAAWGSGEGLTAGQVRLLRPFHFRQRKRPKAG